MMSVMMSLPSDKRSALGSDVVGVVVLLFNHLLAKPLHLIQLVYLSLQGLLELDLVPLQSLHLRH